MKKKKIVSWVIWSCWVAVLVIVLFTLLGCAVGRGQSGEIVLGFEAGRLTETVEQIAGSLATSAFGGYGGIAAGLAGLAVTVFGAKRHADARASIAAKAAEDKGWNDAQSLFAPPPATPTLRTASAPAERPGAAPAEPPAA